MAEGKLTVAEFMTRRVLAVGPDTSCTTAVELMLERKITGAPVIDAEGYPLGVVSLTDLADSRRATSEEFGFAVHYEVDQGEIVARGSGLPVPGGRVRELMSHGALAISALAPLREAAALMVEHHVHRLVVIDGARMLGMLTSLDLARGILRLGDHAAA